MSKSKLLLHLGAPSQDFDLLTRSLRKDHDLLASRNMSLRLPRTYRAAIDEALISQELGQYDDQCREELTNRLRLNGDDARAFASNPNFLGQIDRLFEDGRLYAAAGKASAELRALFPDHDVEFLLTIRNPITMVADLMPAALEGDVSKFTGGIALDQIHWSDVAADIVAANPDCTLTLWPHEDQPLIWPDLLRKVSGQPESTALSGDLDACRPLMGEVPTQRLCDFLAKQETVSAQQRMQITEAFLERFFDPDMAEQEIDLNGIGEDSVACISTAYEADIERCKTIERVKVISVDM